MNRLLCLVAAGAALIWGANKGGPQTFSASFEPEVQSLGAGKSPKFYARRAHGLMMIKTVPAPDGGADLIFQSSTDLGESFAETMKVNHVVGEVYDHGENSPQLLTSPDESSMYAVWNGRDPKNPESGSIRFSRAGTMRTAWSPAVTVNDDVKPASHGFQTAAVAPDGTIYIAWLDGRDGRASTEGATGGTTSIYMTKSTDGGKTWSKNVRVGTNVCPCCRVTWGFVNGKVIIGWRYVEAGDIRDIYTSTSDDKGETWSKAAPVFKDGWKIKGCPHVGPAMAVMNGKLYVTWFTEGSNDPAIYLAVSSDGGKTFAPRTKLSAGTADPTHPQIAVNEDRLAIVFQARDAKVKGGWGKMGVYFREIHADGAMSPLLRAGEGKGTLTYPTAQLGLSGRIFLGWTETVEGQSKAMLLRGRVEK
ncbi:MAG TPA: sialidase family protein [Bryobacteraceae bacterium]|nr:sialidase family protein [Bryobacteraceae bacterium]